jgi:N-carbamoyl-L-amino-acid hydrolase
MTAFDTLWPTILDVGQKRRTGGYRRFAWSDADLTLREWFTGCAEPGMDVEVDRNGNMWAWWMPPDGPETHVARFVTGLTSTRSRGGAFDGPLGVVSAFSAIDIVRERRVVPTIPVAVVAFSDEEGARVRCRLRRIAAVDRRP